MVTRFRAVPIRVWVVLILLWVMGLGLFLAWRDSLTTDEAIHVSSGYLALTRHEFRFDPEHPFLYKMITAAPLLVIRPNLPKEDNALWGQAKPTFYDSWEQARKWADHFFYTSGNNTHLMVFWSRVPTVICTVILCWLVYFLACLWFNQAIGLYALLFMAFNPTIWAHGHLANNDIPIALAILASSYAAWRYLRKPQLSELCWLATAVGVAQITKFTAVGLLPLVVLLFIYQYFKRPEHRKQLLGHLFLLCLVIWFWIWVGYLFSSPLDLSRGTGEGWLFYYVHLDSFHLNRISTIGHWILPSAFVKGLILVQISTLGGRGAYIFNSIHYPGVWYYFPVVFSLKTQVAALLVLLTGIVVGLGRLSNRAFQKWEAVGEPIGRLVVDAFFSLFLILSIVNKLNLGIRHIIPLMPFIAFFFGYTLYQIQKYSRQTWLIVLLLAAYLISPILQLPQTLGYVNAFVRPYNKSYWYMDDSNIEWGEEAVDIVRVKNERFPGEVLYSNFPWSPYVFQNLGVNRVSYNPANPPKAGLFVLTAEELSQSKNARFRDLPILAQVGNAAFFYRLPST